MSSLRLNSNIASLNAQRHFSVATKNLADIYTRLSSGLRINKASDDAAGLAISESLKVETRISNQGVRNLNDGISLLSIADSALGELSNITTRLSELATQSSNGTLADRQRISLDQEAQSLAKEYNRIARSADFNGRKLFDGDFGDLSLAAGGGSNSLIVSGLGGAIGDGTFQTEILTEIPADYSIETPSDFNGDGILDLVTRDYTNGKANILLGNGDGTFKGQVSYVANADPGKIESADLNGDGVLDLFIGNVGGGLGSALLGNGDGTFKARLSIQGINLVSYDLADINGDNVLDIVSSTNPGITTLLGNGDGSFRTGSDNSSSIDLTEISTGDFNQDGITDIAGISNSSHQAVIFLGNGNGSFKTALSFSSGYGPSQFIISDFNNDNILDIGVGRYNSYTLDNKFSILLGNGDGTLKAYREFETEYGANELRAGDANGDGIIDLFSGATDSDTVSVLIGNGNGTFKARNNYGSGLLFTSSRVADFNQDGVVDILSSKGSSLVIMLGNSNEGVSALQAFSLGTKADAMNAMSYFEGAFDRITQQRGKIGAFQSRIEVATSNLQTVTLNLSEANSRITDADIAEESSRLVATQILQKSAARVIALANLQPQVVLKLLKDM